MGYTMLDMKIKFTPLIKKQLTALGIVAVYLFGSRAQGRAGPLSDFDFAILMNKEGHRRGSRLYDEIYDLLSPFCHRTLENDVIDIIFLRDVPLELRMHVVRYGKVLFDHNPSARANFEAETVDAYCDFRPILDMFDKTILASL